jgi:hypothetical protein
MSHPKRYQTTDVSLHNNQSPLFPGGDMLSVLLDENVNLDLDRLHSISRKLRDASASNREHAERLREESRSRRVLPMPTHWPT